MSEVKSLRFNDPDLESWVDEHISKGELNPLMNRLLERYKREQEQEYIEIEQEKKLDKKITIFQGVTFLSIGLFFFVFALSQFYDILSLIATFFMLLSGVLITVYVLIYSFKRKEPKETA
jgi:hypothetical protein